MGPPVSASGGYHTSDRDLNLPFWARITDGDGVLYYSWVEVISDPADPSQWAVRPGGRSGTISNTPAFEENSVTGVANGTIVRMRRARFDPDFGWVHCFGITGAGGGDTDKAAVVRVNNTTPDANGLYDSFLESFDSALLPADPWSDATVIKVISMNP